MAKPKNTSRNRVARRSAPSSQSARERLAALEAELTAALDALPDKIALAVGEAVAHLASSAEVRAVEARLRLAEDAISTMRGQTQGALTLSEQVKGWASAVAPVLWPLLGAAYIAQQAMGAG